jgi:hypothetical protein
MTEDDKQVPDEQGAPQTPRDADIPADEPADAEEAAEIAEGHS